MAAPTRALSELLFNDNKWNKEADEVFKDCFETTDLQMFEDAADGDINDYSGYISKCIDDVVPKATVCT